MENKIRCSWPTNLPIYLDYHDNEWGRPIHNDQKLFEKLILDGMQAGLSWLTILKKREAFRAAFDNFDYHKVAAYDETKVAELLTNPGIIRNRLKINGAITNARLFIEVRQKYGSFDNFVWSYVDYKPIINQLQRLEDMPATSPIADKLSADLKKLGFKFVGPTIMYAFMQAAGLINDHLVDCFVRNEIIKNY
ncbi:MAG: DNA-3-methyladenine glycosylase I [Spirochaetaceae bacterium]|nr:DNA-3-methyladenine glycosylase I [Spirochaetaceae bacterium]